MRSAAASRELIPSREVIGIYKDIEELDIAVNDLVDAGLNFSQIGLLAKRNTIKEHLDETYREIPAVSSSPHHKVEFVGKRSARPNLSTRLGGLGPLNPLPSGSEIVASRTILANAAFTAITGTHKKFGYGLSAIESSIRSEGKTGPNYENTLAKALNGDGRLLLLVSERNDKMGVAKEVLDFSDSANEGIIEVNPTLESPKP